MPHSTLSSLSLHVFGTYLDTRSSSQTPITGPEVTVVVDVCVVVVDDDVMQTPHVLGQYDRTRAATSSVLASPPFAAAWQLPTVKIRFPHSTLSVASGSHHWSPAAAHVSCSAIWTRSRMLRLPLRACLPAVVEAAIAGATMHGGARLVLFLSACCLQSDDNSNSGQRSCEWWYVCAHARVTGCSLEKHSRWPMCGLRARVLQCVTQARTHAANTHARARA